MDNNLEILIMFDAKFSQKQLSQLKEIAPQAIISNVNSDKVSTDILKKAEIIFGWPKEEDLRKAKKLKWLHLPSAGASKYIDQSLYQNQDIKLTNSSGVYGLPIAEHVLGMILAFNKNLPLYLKQKEEQKWNSISPRKDIYGSTFGIIGLGDLGRAIARRAKALGAKVLAVKRTLTKTPAYIDKLYSQADIETVLQRSDYVILTLPLTEATEGIISEKELKLMKDDAFLVNVGRGGLIIQDNLIKALTEGWIAGAGLDVTTPEPLPADNPLWRLDNVIITPHCSGYSPTNTERLYDIFSQNLQNYIEEQPLDNIVSFKNGY